MVKKNIDESQELYPYRWPDVCSELFQFKVFSKQLADFLLDRKIPTPYTIGLHGEWGGGKTTLIRRTYELLSEQIPDDWTTIWFDAWEYERLDPMLSLMQAIAAKYPKRSEQFKKVLMGLLRLTSDITLRATVGLRLEEIESNFKSSVKNIPTITQQLENMLRDGRLIVFIDDLDRCLVDNALSILEAVKLFLNANGLLFVIAVDMRKLERELRYGGLRTGLIEGREHVDKIFQLKLSLPPKESTQIESYINILASSLPQKECKLIVEGCPSNPRKIKRILNLVYFLTKGIEVGQVEKYFPFIVIWSIATVAFPELAQVIKDSPQNSLVQMVLMTYHFGDLENLLLKLPVLKKVHETSSGVSLSDSLSISHKQFDPSALRGLVHAATNPRAFDFLKAVANHSSISVTKETQANLESPANTV